MAESRLEEYIIYTGSDGWRIQQLSQFSFSVIEGNPMTAIPKHLVLVVAHAYMHGLYFTAYKDHRTADLSNMFRSLHLGLRSILVFCRRARLR